MKDEEDEGAKMSDIAEKEKKYDVRIDDRILTPVTLKRLKRLIAEGRLKKYHRIRVTGLSRWRKAGDIPELKPFFKES